MAFNIRVWFVPFGLHLASPILGSSLSLLTLPFLPFPAYGPLAPLSLATHSVRAVGVSRRNDRMSDGVRQAKERTGVARRSG